jgi:hypothetical protein
MTDYDCLSSNLACRYRDASGFCDHSCVTNDDCLGYQSCELALRRKVCKTPDKACALNCTDSSHGHCMFLDVASNERLKYCPIDDASCIARCSCQSNYWGPGCEWSISEGTSRMRMRKQMLASLADITAREDADFETVTSWLETIANIVASGIGSIEISADLVEQKNFILVLGNVLKQAEAVGLAWESIWSLLPTLDVYMEAVAGVDTAVGSRLQGWSQNPYPEDKNFYDNHRSLSTSTNYNTNTKSISSTVDTTASLKPTAQNNVTTNITDANAAQYAGLMAILDNVLGDRVLGELDEVYIGSMFRIHTTNQRIISTNGDVNITSTVPLSNLERRVGSTTSPVGTEFHIDEVHVTDATTSDISHATIQRKRRSYGTNSSALFASPNGFLPPVLLADPVVLVARQALESRAFITYQNSSNLYNISITNTTSNSNTTSTVNVTKAIANSTPLARLRATIRIPAHEALNMTDRNARPASYGKQATFLDYCFDKDFGVRQHYCEVDASYVSYTCKGVREVVELRCPVLLTTPKCSIAPSGEAVVEVNGDCDMT